MYFFSNFVLRVLLRGDAIIESSIPIKICENIIYLVICFMVFILLYNMTISLISF